MLIDVTLRMTSQMLLSVIKNAAHCFPGHVGTHFDSIGKEFPLEYLERHGVVFDVSNLDGQEIKVSDVDLSLVQAGMFVAFCSNYSETIGYGSNEYFDKSPKISYELIYELLKKNVCIVGLDFGRPTQCRIQKILRYCLEGKEPFVIENLCNLKSILNGRKAAYFKASTFPMHYEGFSGNPCRVIAKVEKK
ncbi:cyclase family protein [Anaerotignum sp. MB30-C6]|uniref:cyclase family protein n=1 Tax=Anaerotignum sp. MB30-C6 TaxID=3070814 RepID=UPI0027DC8934|nr:cyclase family protein [Anaerotignum sp. MB30-C6]WMI82124.1 cyclase family protein [Anaerotignum sp. MB30-C6]